MKENEIEAQNHEFPVVNNIEIIPTIADEIKFQILDQNNKIEGMNEEVKEILENDQFKPNVGETIENEKTIEEVILDQKSGLNENSFDSEVKDLHQETLVNIVENEDEDENENVIDSLDNNLINFVDNIIIPTKETNEVITEAAPEKVEVDVSVPNSTKILEESTSIIDGDISEEIIEPPVEEVLEEIVESQSGVAEELIETIEDSKSKEIPPAILSDAITQQPIPAAPTDVEVMDKPIVEERVETALETILDKEEVSIPEAIVEAAQPEVVEPEVVEPQTVEHEVAQPEPEVVETVPETVVEQEVVETTPETVDEPQVVEQEVAQPEVVETVPETVVEQEVVETTPETVDEPQVVEQEVAQTEVVETVPETAVEPQVVEQKVTQPEVVETVPETVVEPQVVEQEVAQPEVVETFPETVVEPQVVEQEVTQPEVVETVPETVVEQKVVEQGIAAEPEVTEKAQPESVIESEVIEVVSEANKPEINENVVEEIIEQQATEFSGDISEPQITEEIIEVPDINEEKSFLFEKPQNIDNLINEIEKVVNDSDSDSDNIIEEKEKEKEEVVKPKPINSKDIVGHEEIIYEDNGDGNDDGEWIDEDDDGEWVDEDDDGEWVDEDDDDGEWIDEEEEVKPEVNKRQSLLINTDPNKRQSLILNTDPSKRQSLILNTDPSKRQSLILNTDPSKRQSLILNTDPSKRQSLILNTPLDRKRQSLLLNTPITREVLNSFMTPLSANSSSFPLPTPAPAPVENKPKVLPDDILERIFRETDPQTMWVLRNTSIKTRNIVDNILKETFEQFDLSMDPLYFDVTSKDNLGLVLNSLELSPFALAMLLHEILKLDSQHIGYAFGQMFRVPSKIDFDYLTDLIVDTLNILRSKKGVDIADIMLGLQHYYCFNHSELEFYQLFDLIEMTPEEVARFIQNHYHFILSKSLPPLLQALDVDEVFVADMCKAYANDDMDAFARIISKVPVRFVRTSVHPSDVQGDRVVVVNENGEDVIVVLNDDDHKHGRGKAPADVDDDDEEWEEEGDDENGKNIEEEEEEDDDDDEIEGGGNRDSMIIVENNQSFSLFVGRILRFLNMTTKDVASFLKYLPEYCSYDEDEILEGLNWNEEQINEMRQIMKDEQDKIARKMRELSKLIIQRRMSISSGIGSPLSGSPSVSHPSNRQFY
ncbi:hypothetical protein H8356DRAFT_1031523 [Neocallimastix lanati (nom. inval.)]|nr:hypothetical protein H8356DRAFT_1031523 [Neocallimastix sp. JGI-2020a]